MIVRSSALGLSNNIIQKGLAFGRDWSGTVASSGRYGRSEILPRRLVGRDGASVVRRNAAMNRTEDLHVKVCEEAAGCVIDNACSCRTARTIDHRKCEELQGQSWLEAISRHRDAAVPEWDNDRRDDEGNGLAAALGAWFPSWRGAQASQTKARLQEGGWTAGLPDCQRRQR